MVFTGKPSTSGIYRIKVQGKDLLLESDPGKNGGLRLFPRDDSNSKQRWDIRPQGGNDYTITSVFDRAGLTYYVSDQAYWGYGYPLPGDPGSDSVLWSLYDRGSYSKIYRKGTFRPMDSCDPDSNAVHFYSDKSDHIEQRFEFELISSN